MNENRPADDQELIDVLIAISVVAKRMERNLEILREEKKHLTQSGRLQSLVTA